MQLMISPEDLESTFKHSEFNSELQ